MTRELRIFPDAAALAQAAAALIVATVQRHPARCTVALSGGSTPKAVFQLLAHPPLRDALPLDNLHLFWGDERTVPPTHPDSNFHMASAAWLDHVPFPAGQLHRMRTELPASAAATAYQSELEAVFGPALPCFNLVLLGLGDDGHTASLFPHTAALTEETRWVVANPVPQLHTERVTLTYPVINNAEQVVFLVSGASKAAILSQVLEGPVDCQQLPSQGIQPTSGHLLWLLDQAAAAQLTK